MFNSEEESSQETCVFESEEEQQRYDEEVGWYLEDLVHNWDAMKIFFATVDEVSRSEGEAVDRDAVNASMWLVIQKIIATRDFADMLHFR